MLDRKNHNTRITLDHLLVFEDRRYSPLFAMKAYDPWEGLHSFLTSFRVASF
jgi:hypothetical protein